MKHRTHYMPKRGPGRSPWDNAAANKGAAPVVLPVDPDTDSPPEEMPEAPLKPEVTPNPAAIEPGGEAAAAEADDGRVFVRTER